MKLLCGLLGFILVIVFGGVECRVLDEPEIFSNDAASDPIKTLTKAMDSMNKTIAAMGRQMMLQQLFIEERIRSDADSGIKQIRDSREGTRNYYAPSHTSGASVVAIHDHSNNERTVGMGEFIGVLNGVEFRTRHNDYRLYMPHKTSDKWHAIENIPFPDVPKAVTDKASVNDQIVEMREWFKAWRDQDHSVRDYRPYFRPVVSYLEGAWTTATSGKIDEPFESDRHFVDASSWFDLQEKVRFTSYTGRKDNLENFSFLPTTIMNVTEGGYPQFSQWNYRILCHPIGRDIPLNRFRVVDELGSQLSSKRTYKEHSMSRAARFQLNPFDKDKWTEANNGGRWGLLDKIMSEIPGKNNYQGNLTDDAFGLPALSKAPGKDADVLRADRYHRWFKVGAKGAMGESTRHRGFSDENLFMAMTTQPKVAGMTLSTCKKVGKNKVCNYLNQKWSYAIPLEIIYLTPLSKWNPYDIEYKGDARYPRGKTVEAGGRNGQQTVQRAYNGTHSKKFYQTPVEFFSGKEVGSGAADTTRNSVGVLDKQGNVRVTKASGTRIFFPQIPGVGTLRQRYPIMPVHGEGSAVWKELEAVKDILLKSKTNGYVLHESLSSGPLPTEPPRKGITLQITRARTKHNPPGPHEHEIAVSADQVDFLRQGGTLTLTSTTAASHEHTVVLTRRGSRYYIEHCDSYDTAKTRCRDLHGRFPVKKPDQ